MNKLRPATEPLFGPPSGSSAPAVSRLRLYVDDQDMAVNVTSVSVESGALVAAFADGTQIFIRTWKLAHTEVMDSE